MDLIFDSVAVGIMSTNCYILGDAQTKEAVIIDPGADSVSIKRMITKHRLHPKCIINTHGHADHIGANPDFHLPIWIHSQDADFLTDPAKNLSKTYLQPFVSTRASHLLEDSELLKIGDIDLQVIHTPGHTPGSICLKCGDILLTGDTLFCEGVGRTDFPYGSEDDLFKSIKEKIMVLDGKTKIFPGHGPPSTIEHERENNPFLG